MDFKRLKFSPPAWLIIIISLCSFVQFLNSPFSGDDWGYLGVWAGENARCTDLFSYIKWGGWHWLSINGRAANIVMTVFLSMNKIVLSAACTLMIALMFSMPLKLAKVERRQTLSVVLIAAMAFVLPWWDSMHIFDCQFNYIWTSSLATLAVYIILNVGDLTKWQLMALSALCLLSGMMHESATMPLCVGLFAHIYVNKWRPIGAQRTLLIAFAIGSALATFAPGIISRLGSGVPADDTPLWLVLKSDAVVALLLVFCALCSLSSKGRGAVGKMIHSPLLIFAIAATVSMCVGVASGVVGRSGWFAELYEMIVIVGWLAMSEIRLPRMGKVAVSTVFALTIVAHYAFVAYWQVGLGKQHERFEELYKRSDDGIVFMDYMRDNEIPWYDLNRLRGIPDNDDVYLLDTFAEFNSTHRIAPIVLPPFVADLNVAELDGELQLGNGDIISTALPDGAYNHLAAREQRTMLFFERDGEKWVARPFEMRGRQLYLLSERIQDPGDR